MAILSSNASPNSETFKANAAAMLAAIDEVRLRCNPRDGGGGQTPSASRSRRQARPQERA